ncbi:flagellin [Natrarchaeobius oligotrophus]|uniref:Flagellin n=1 Tax=Natrarchaeobius chitinivorans TaxID=1679083 RepID=A0A3N6M9N9_NATCH|nr:flagellin [Natrarchaeobius chitinivorans]RQG99157.1 flagellin [Natrarchaeobius chitinivorans]
MSGVSATHLILFVASLTIAAAITGTLVVETGQLSNAIETRGSNVADEIKTDVAVISDEATTEAVYDESENEVTVLVKNTGSRSLSTDPSTFDVLVDGTYVPSGQLTTERVDADSDAWRPGGVVEVTVDLEEKAPNGDTEIAIIVNGNEDSIDVYID